MPNDEHSFAGNRLAIDHRVGVPAEWKPAAILACGCSEPGVRFQYSRDPLELLQESPGNACAGFSRVVPERIGKVAACTSGASTSSSKLCAQPGQNFIDWNFSGYTGFNFGVSTRCDGAPGSIPRFVRIQAGYYAIEQLGPICRGQPESFAFKSFEG
jgi:hypothetical protein